MRYRVLGDSGFEVSALAFGAWQLGDTEYWGADDAVDFEATVNLAIDAGINLFDTAELYGDGESERVLGRVLGSRRDDVLIASKAIDAHCAPEELRAACEASLQRLGTNRIDLYQIHWPNREVPFEDTYGALARFKEEGKIRAFGVSNFGPKDLQAWSAFGTSASNQVGYNIAFRAVEYEIIPACRKHGLGVLVYMPLLQGVLSGRWKRVEDIPMWRRRIRHYASTRPGARHGEKGCEELLMETVAQLGRFGDAIGIPLATMCLSWLAIQPGVTSVILGARNPAQLEGNLAAGDFDLGPAAIAQLNEISGPLKTLMGSNADLWQGADDSRIH